MSAKQEAFRLFDQGKRPGNPELRLLGLASATVKKYYASWGQGQAQVTEQPLVTEAQSLVAEPQPLLPKAPIEVQLGNLKIAQLFTLGGATYRVAESTPEFVRVTKLKEISYDVNATMLLVIGQATLATSTLVKPE